MRGEDVRVLVCAKPVPGHLFPLVAVARLLRSNGMSTIVAVSPGSVIGDVSRDIDFIDDQTLPALGPEEEAQSLSCSSAKRILKKVLLGTAAEEEAFFRRVILETGPSLVLADAVSFGAVVAAETCGISWRTISTTYLPLVDGDWANTLESITIENDIRGYFRDQGVSTPRIHIVECLGSDVLVLGGASIARALHSSMEGVTLGGTIVLRDRHIEAGYQPKCDVYCTFGTLSPPDRELLLRLGEHCQLSGLHMVFAPATSVDRCTVTMLERLGVHCRPWINQFELIRRSRLVVSHGGANTFRECLVAGVPHAVSPVTFDQPVQAALVGLLGVGRRINAQNFAGVVKWALSSYNFVQQNCREHTRRVDYQEWLRSSARAPCAAPTAQPRSRMR